MVCYSVYRRIISVLLSIEIIVDPFIGIEDKTIWCRDFIASSEMLTFPFITGSAVSFPLQKSWSTDHTFRCLAVTAGLLSRSADGSPDASSSRVWQVEPRRYAGRRRSQVNERTSHSCATFPHITSHCQLHASTHAHSRRRHLIVVPVSWYNAIVATSQEEFSRFKVMFTIQFLDFHTLRVPVGLFGRQKCWESGTRNLYHKKAECGILGL